MLNNFSLAWAKKLSLARSFGWMKVALTWLKSRKYEMNICLIFLRINSSLLKSRQARPCRNCEKKNTIINCECLKYLTWPTMGTQAHDNETQSRLYLIVCEFSWPITVGKKNQWNLKFLSVLNWELLEYFDPNTWCKCALIHCMTKGATGFLLLGSGRTNWSTNRGKRHLGWVWKIRLIATLIARKDL